MSIASRRRYDRSEKRRAAQQRRRAAAKKARESRPLTAQEFEAALRHFEALRRERRAQRTTPTPALPRCDLCGQETEERLDGGAEFEIKDLICLECRDDLSNERAFRRYRSLKSVAYIPPRGRTAGPATRFLPVLNADFAWEDLTARAACRVILADATTRRVFGRRASA